MRDILARSTAIGPPSAPGLHFNRSAALVGFLHRAVGARPDVGNGVRDVTVAETILIVFIFVFGACVGSFLNVVIYRMPRGQSIVSPPSHCPRCGKQIKWYDNIPILSWLVLRGRCRFCGVRISPRYIVIEAFTGAIVVGLYLAYFVYKVRRLSLGPQDHVPLAELDFFTAWPMFIAYAAMLCGLLACAAVDIEHFIVPLPVMWTVAIIGAAATAFRPHPFLASVSGVTAAMSLAAAIGIAWSLLAVHKGWLTPSFIDAGDRMDMSDSAANNTPGAAKCSQGGGVGVTEADGVNPRVEVLRELLFLVPAFLLAIGAWASLTYVPAAGRWWGQWFDAAAHPVLAPRLSGVGGALFGFLVGGLWIWGTRIVATLAFGREAMGMGDVHILAGVGAVTGWVVPSLAFFLAPVSGVLLVLYLFATRRQRELPYGPWLAIGAVLAILLYDSLVRYVGPGLIVLFG